LALDALTGKSLWNFQTGGAVRSNPMSFGVMGREYVVIAAGNAIYAFTTLINDAMIAPIVPMSEMEPQLGTIPPP